MAGTAALVRPLALAIGLVAIATHAAAQERVEFGPFYALTDDPTTLYLDGFLERGAYLDFARISERFPDAAALILNSDGGQGYDAAIIADFVRVARLDTNVPDGASCSSACVLIFMAGIGRTLNGRMGLHQPAPSANGVVAQNFNQEAAAFGITFFAGAMERYGAPDPMVEIVRSTPFDDAYFLSRDDVTRFGLERSRSSGLATLDQGAPVEPYPDQLSYAQIGGVLEASRLSGTVPEVSELAGTVQWYFAQHPAYPEIAAVISLEELDYAIQIYLQRIVSETVPFAYVQVSVAATAGSDRVTPIAARVVGYAIDTGEVEWRSVRALSSAGDPALLLMRGTSELNIWPLRKEGALFMIIEDPNGGDAIVFAQVDAEVAAAIAEVLAVPAY